MIDISKALAIDGWMTEKELTWLAERAANIGTGLAVEIGTWKGRSARAIGDNLKPGAILWCIDPFIKCMTMPDDFGSDICEAWERNMKDLVAVEKVFLWVERSQIAYRGFDREIDFLFIDGDHNYLSVKEDIDLWLPKVKPGGIISGHDYGVWPGVEIAVSEKFPKVEIVDTIWSIALS